MSKNKKNKSKTSLTFSFNKTVADKLRNTAGKHLYLFKDWIKPIQLNKKSVNAWNKYNSCLTRIAETLDYINTMNLGEKMYPQAFDFYEFMLHADVVIKSIEELINILGIRYKDSILLSNECFGQAIYVKKYDIRKKKYIKDIEVIRDNEKSGNDGKFWEYLRSITTVHPINTTKANFLDGLEKKTLHTSPYAVWNIDNVFFDSISFPNLNIVVVIWKGEPNEVNNHVLVHTSMIEKYINKWIFALNIVENEIESLIIKDKEKLSKKRIKTIEDFNYDWELYLNNLKKEYTKRYNRLSEDKSYETELTMHVNKSLKTIFKDSYKQEVLKQYNVLLKKEIFEFHNKLQDMTLDDEYEIHNHFNFNNYKDLTVGENLTYEFSKLSYIHNVSHNNPNEIYEANDAINLLYEELEGINALLPEEQKLHLKNLEIAQPCTNAEWGRTMAVRIGELLIKDWFPIDYNVNDWQLYLQIVLAFFIKSDLYSKENKEEF